VSLDLNQYLDLTVREPSGCWLWTRYRTRKGYGYGLARSGGSHVLVHREVYRLSHGGTALPPGMCVCHRCDRPPCINPAHLFLGTQADNAADRDAKGRSVYMRGERHGSARLTEAQVRSIRAERCGRTLLRVLAERYGVSESTINDVISCRTWRHLTDEPAQAAQAEGAP
jgi:HNH endonuclease